MIKKDRYKHLQQYKVSTATVYEHMGAIYFMSSANLWRMWATKAPLLHVYVPSSDSEKHQDTVTSNEQRTSHPIGYPVYLESAPA